MPKPESLPINFSDGPWREFCCEWDIRRGGESILELSVGAVDLDRGIARILDLPARVDPITRQVVWRYIDGDLNMVHIRSGVVVSTNADALMLIEALLRGEDPK